MSKLNRFYNVEVDAKMGLKSMLFGIGFTSIRCRKLRASLFHTDSGADFDIYDKTI